MELLKRTVNSIEEVDRAAVLEAKKRLDNLTKPTGSLGMLEEIAAKMAGITGIVRGRLPNKVVIVMAADHGVAAEKVSAYPQEVTVQMVHNFVNGGAAINVLSRHIGAKVVVVDIGVNSDIVPPGVIDRKIKKGTDNFIKGPAMSREEAIKAIEVGIEIAGDEIQKGADLIGIGEMGIANTTASSALLAALTGCSVEDVTGMGSGLDDQAWKRKVEVIKKALEVNVIDPDDPIDVLAKVGGLEIAGMAGCILGAGAQKKPVVIDGFISGVAALVASRIAPLSVNYMFPSHCSMEPGHRIVLEHLGLKPALFMDMRLGEGTGGVLMMHIIDAALRIIDEMATFEEAGVSQKCL